MTQGRFGFDEARLAAMRGRMLAVGYSQAEADEECAEAAAAWAASSKWPAKAAGQAHGCADGARSGDEGEACAAVPFERIRRITGYLVGTTARFNDAKKAEVADRVTHPVPPGAR
jgi:hypothetical protein